MIFVIEPGKQILSTQNTLVYIMACIFCSVCAIQNLLILLNSSWISAYDEILDTIQITDKKLLHFKLSKSGQILHVDKTCFPRPSHILLLLCSYIIMCVHMCINEKVSKLQNEIR